MAEFNRIKRYYNYHHPLCKKYLRIDFCYKCAYCGASEAEFITGHDAFEMDHFKPRNLSLKDTENNKYRNLYYSCQICNGVTGKGANWSSYLLDPCKHDIYGEENHILFGNDKNDHKLIPLTMEGEFYIDTINLNQQKQRFIRRKRHLYNMKLQEQKIETIRLQRNINRISERLIDNFDEELFEIREALSNQLKRIEEDNLGAYNFKECIDHELYDHKHEAVFESVAQQLLQFNKVYGNYDLDYETTLENGKRIECLVRFHEIIKFTGGVKRIKISKEQAGDWKEYVTKSKVGLCILLFNCSDKKIYYSYFNEFSVMMDLSKYNIFVSIPVQDTNELCSESFERFCATLTRVPSGESGVI